MKLFSYVVEHDTGMAPNPEGKVCTLVYCKYKKRNIKQKNIVELAKKGDWIIGTGGKNKKKSSGHGTIIYIMRVDKKLKFEVYLRRYPNRSRPRKEGDHGDYALISHTFLYFGRNKFRISDIPISIRRQIRHRIEKKGPNFRSDFPVEFICSLDRWVRTCRIKGKIGEPCMSTINSNCAKKCRCGRNTELCRS